MFQGILTDQDIEQIHQTSMRLLEKVGVEFPYEEALETFRQHGSGPRAAVSISSKTRL